MSGNIYTDNSSFFEKEQSNQQCYGDIKSVKAIQAGKLIEIQIAMKLEDLNISEELKRNLVRGVDLYQGLERVQQVAIPTFLSYGNDQVVISPTGSGKTLAYVLPILDNLIRDVSTGEENHRVNTITGQKIYYPRAIIIVPTREIAIQVKDVFETLSSGFDSIHFLLAVGGLKTNYSDIDDKTHLIMIGTVGRIIQELGNPKNELGRSRISLKMTRFIVLDEADRLVQKGFCSFYYDIEYIYKGCDLLDTCYSLMFSATFPPNAQYLAKDFLFEDHITIEIARPGSANKRIIQEFIECNPAIEILNAYNGKLTHYAVPEENLRKLVQILNAELAKSDDCRILIFVKDPELAGRKISQYLEESIISHVMLAGFYQTIIDKNGKEQEISVPQEERNEQLQLFAEGKVRVMISSALAERGLDIPKLDVVINFDLPTNINRYVQRIGRTGRAGRPGKSYTFFPNSCPNRKEKEYDNFARALANVVEEARQKVPTCIENVIGKRKHIKPYEFMNGQMDNQSNQNMNASSSNTEGNRRKKRLNRRQRKQKRERKQKAVQPDEVSRLAGNLENVVVLGR